MAVFDASRSGLEAERMRFEAVMPVFRIFSVEKAKEFYLDFLGFSLDWEHRFEEGTPLYLQVSRNGLTLHLSEHHGDACPGSTLFVETEGLEDFHRELAGRDYPYLRPGIQEAPWGAKLMEVVDPFGNRIRFNQQNRDG